MCIGQKYVSVFVSGSADVLCMKYGLVGRAGQLASACLLDRSIASNSKVALKERACDAAEAVAGVLLVDRVELGIDSILGGKNLTSD